MKKQSALIALLGVLALVACGKPKAAAPTPPIVKVAAEANLPLRCSRPVFDVSFGPIKQVSLEELSTRGAKRLRLASVERFSTLELIQNGQTRRGAVHFRSLISPQATAEKLDTHNEILCRDMSRLPTKVMNDAAQVPFLVDLGAAALGAISSDVELTTKVVGSERTEAESIGIAVILPFDSHWQKFTARLGKEMDQYSLYELSPNRLGMFSEKQFRTTRLLVNEQTNQTAVFDTLTHIEYFVE
jgi:hypothetical protein